MPNETQHVSDDGKGQSKGREDNAVQPLESPGESRSFDPSVSAPAPRQGGGDASEIDEGRLGPRGDPAEGKR
jgi:hypothetical protein